MIRIFSMMLVLMIFLFISCKSEKDIVSTFKRTISYSDSTVYFQATQEEPKIKQALKVNAFFYYLKNGAIASTEAGYYGEVLNGEFAVVNTENQLISKGNFDEGLKEGVWIRWNERGSIVKKTPYENGVVDGVMEIYQGDTLVFLTKYKDGEKHGFEKHFLDGVLIEKSKFKEDRKHGKSKKFDIDGNLVEVNYYKKGRLIRSKNHHRKQNFTEEEASDTSKVEPQP